MYHALLSPRHKICDDERVNCRIMLRKLQQSPIKELCWNAEFAHSLSELTSKCLQQPFDLLLLDEHFPGTDTTGSEYIATLAQQGIHTPVLIASANCSDIDLALYLSRYDHTCAIYNLSRLYAKLCQLHSFTMVELLVAWRPMVMGQTIVRVKIRREAGVQGACDIVRTVM